MCAIDVIQYQTLEKLKFGDKTHSVARWVQRASGENVSDIGGALTLDMVQLPPGEPWINHGYGPVHLALYFCLILNIMICLICGITSLVSISPMQCMTWCDKMINFSNHHLLTE